MLVILFPNWPCVQSLFFYLSCTFPYDALKVSGSQNTVGKNSGTSCLSLS
jgi:hypothetical protein